VDAELEGKVDPDAGPSGPACDNTQQCLRISDRIFDCSQQCVDGVCVTGRTTPDGIACGEAGSDQICVSASCVPRECGDGYVDRTASPPEFCDDGNDNDGDACNNNCTRSCVPPAPAVCDDGDPCNGVESCDSVCQTEPQEPDGTECSTDDVPDGVCQRGECVAE
jgi:cysteine-rich repeat protein